MCRPVWIPTFVSFLQRANMAPPAAGSLPSATALDIDVGNFGKRIDAYYDKIASLESTITAKPDVDASALP